MTTDPRPTPPPELVPDLWAIYHRASIDDVRSAWTASVNAAFQAGADQQLEACCTWLSDHGYIAADPDLRAAMRPQPPSLKEQALKELERINGWDGIDAGIIRHALALVPEGPAVTPDDARGPGSVAEQAGPVATDEGLYDLWEGARSGPYTSLRAVYNLGREHGAAAHKREQEIVRTGQWLADRARSVAPAPAPAEDGDEPLHRLMACAYADAGCPGGVDDPESYYYAAEIRCVADWLERMGDGTPWMEEAGVFAASLRAEAERAEQSP